MKAFADFGDVVFGTGVSYRHNYYPQVYRSRDDGLTWETVWIGAFESDVKFSGYEWASKPAVPNGANGELQSFLSGNCGALEYPTMRLFSGTSGHHEATFYARLPKLVQGGSNYELYCDLSCGGSSYAPEEVFSKELMDSPHEEEFRWPLDECQGTQVSASGPNSLAGTLSNAGLWREGDGRKVGYRYPRLSLPGCHLETDGLGRLQTSGLPFAESAPGFAMVAWFRLSQEIGTSEPYLASGGTDEAGWELRLATGGYEVLSVWNGDATCLIDSTSPDKRLDDWIQDGFFLTWDEASPTITFVSNGMIGKVKPYAAECGLEPFLGGGPVTLGGSMFHDEGLVGGVDELYVAYGPLTALHLRSAFEMCPVEAPSPKVAFWRP